MARLSSAHEWAIHVNQYRAVFAVWMLVLATLSGLVIGLVRLTNPAGHQVVEVPVAPASDTADPDALVALLAINEQAAGYAGYPAIVKAKDRRSVAAQAAVKVGELLTQASKIDDPYAVRQASALSGLRRGLEMHVAGEGMATLGAASAFNAELHEQMARELAWTRRIAGSGIR
jgi:hypothetical protein